MRIKSVNISIPIDWVGKTWNRIFNVKKKHYLVEEGMQFPFCGMWFRVKKVKEKGIWCVPFGVTKKLKAQMRPQEK